MGRSYHIENYILHVNINFCLKIYINGGDNRWKFCIKVQEEKN